MHRERFAPSPTGPLHLGHAFSALTAWDAARATDGEFLLRIEDIDQARARPEWEQQIYDDLHWLGLRWPLPVMRQSERLGIYRQALQDLWSLGVLYPCTCNRRDILAAANAPQEGGNPLLGPDGIIYPGTCRPAGQTTGDFPQGCVLRLNMARALKLIAPDVLRFCEVGNSSTGRLEWISFSTNDLSAEIGDVVLARRDFGTSYHLSVVVDDADQAISHITRGRDLFDATRIHVVLQRLLNLPTPIYNHHRLIRDEAGKRLAKRDDARAIAAFRADGASPADIRLRVGL